MAKKPLTYLEQLLSDHVEGNLLTGEPLRTKEDIQAYVNEMEEATKDKLDADIKAREGSQIAARSKWVN